MGNSHNKVLTWKSQIDPSTLMGIPVRFNMWDRGVCSMLITIPTVNTMIKLSALPLLGRYKQTM